MHPLRFAWLVVVVTHTSCVFVPAPYSAQLNPVAAKYAAIARGHHRVEVEAQLGLPNRVEADGTSVWETRFDDVNYAELKVWFDAAGTAERLEMTRAHGKIGPHGRAAAVSTRTR